MLSDSFNEVVQLIVDLFAEYPFLFFVPFAVVCFHMMFSIMKRLLFYDRSVYINWGIKDLFLKIVNKVLPFEWCYKMGWARPGIDFVECESQDCSTCPFNGKCTSELRRDRV